MGQALYRKYRSRSLAEVAGQEHITKTLSRALKTGSISHAYLFTGPRGVGKTSVARILAHEINNLPYTDETAHLDIIEIDAASNRRIDEIRDLRDKVHIAPTSATYKVYIIDEVHMLTREAFNALLKTLEEPPAHAVFILATTELHKLPETIVSRTQRFAFKPIDVDTAVKHLTKLAKAEGITIDKQALTLLAEHGQGSFRDSISLLDQVGRSGGSITAEDVRSLIGLASSEHVEQIMTSVFEGTPADIMDALNACIADGVGPAQVAKQVSAVARQHILGPNQAHTDVLLQLLGDLVDVPASGEPSGALEIALFRAHLAVHPVAKKTPSPAKTAEAVAPPPAVATATPAPPKQTESLEALPQKAADTPKPQNKETEAPANIQAKGSPAEWWSEVLQHIKSANNTLYGILRMAEPRIDDDTLHLSFGFGFHKKKAADAETQAKIHEAVTKVTGTSYRINAVHDKNLTKTALPAEQPDFDAMPADPPAEENSELTSITNIFGGGEVLES